MSAPSDPAAMSFNVSLQFGSTSIATRQSCVCECVGVRGWLGVCGCGSVCKCIYIHIYYIYNIHLLIPLLKAGPHTQLLRLRLRLRRLRPHNARLCGGAIHVEALTLLRFTLLRFTAQPLPQSCSKW